MEGDTEANWKLQIFKAKVGRVKPLINEVMDDCHIKERQIIEDLCFFLALDQLLKSIICKIFLAGQINVLFSQNGSRSQCLISILDDFLCLLRLLGYTR